MTHSINETDPSIATCVIGLAFGDEGKGMTVAYECRRRMESGLEPVVVRFNGGPQAAHNVRIRRDDGTVLHHVHQQIGSGAMYGAETILSSGMLVSLHGLINEIQDKDLLIALQGRKPKIIVSENAPLLLPLHAVVNKALEDRRGDKAHGSCGIGIGICRTCEAASNEDDSCKEHMITVGSVSNSIKLYDDMMFWLQWLSKRFEIDLSTEYEIDADVISMWISDLTNIKARLNDSGIIFLDDCDEYIREKADADKNALVFEGAQGILLDERYGWFPHVTYGDMTPLNAVNIMNGDGTNRELRIIGCTRTYATRHGYGPFPSANGTMRSSIRNDEELGTIIRAMSDGIISNDKLIDWGRNRHISPLFEIDNGIGRYQGDFRTGLLDVPDLRFVCNEVCNIDAVSISNIDRYPGSVITDFSEYENIDGVRRSVPRKPVVKNISDDDIVEYISKTVGTDVVIKGASPVVDDWK